MNDKDLIFNMLQACKNIISATSRLKYRSDFFEDNDVLEHVMMCLRIIVEDSLKVSDDVKNSDSVLDWSVFNDYVFLLKDSDDSSIDVKALSYTCFDRIPLLKNKLEVIMAGLKKSYC